MFFFFNRSLQVEVKDATMCHVDVGASSKSSVTWSLSKATWRSAVSKNDTFFLVILNGLDEGKIYRKAPYVMGKSMVSCKFSLKPIHWYSIRRFLRCSPGVLSISTSVPRFFTVPMTSATTRPSPLPRKTTSEKSMESVDSIHVNTLS